jgi:hypothetical protein
MKPNSKRWGWSAAERGAFTLGLGLACTALVQPAAHAASVSFWFSGTISDVEDPGQSLPIAVHEGDTYFGHITYDTAKIASDYIRSFPSGDTATYYFDKAQGFQIEFYIAGHTITSVPPTEYYSGLVSVYDQYNNSDSLTFESAHSKLLLDGSPFVSGNRFTLISLYLNDATKTALTSTVAPAQAPDLSLFGNSHYCSWGTYLDDGGPSRVYSVSGDMNAISADEIVLLNYHPLGGNQLRLEWPPIGLGYHLESTPSLTSPNWQPVNEPVVDINAWHTVTVSSSAGTRFFRLAK